MPLEAASMALLRIVHAASLPDPGELARRLENGELTIGGASGQTADSTGEQPPLLSLPSTFNELIELLGQKGKHLLAQKLHDAVGLVRYAPPDLVIRPTQKLEADFARDLGGALKAITGEAWSISIAEGPSEPSLLEQEKVAKKAERDAIMTQPIVQAAFEAFPDAELIEYSAASNGA